MNSEPQIPRKIAGFNTDSIPVLEPGDGGLEQRQVYRQVKERMEHPHFRRSKMLCAAPKKDGSKCARPFRSWSALRSHLVTYHRIDRREIPE